MSESELARLDQAELAEEVKQNCLYYDTIDKREAMSERNEAMADRAMGKIKQFKKLIKTGVKRKIKE